MALVRTAIVVSAVIMMLPSDKAKQEQLYVQAVSYAQDAVTYCDRHADTCAKAQELWVDFKAKAAFAGEIAYEAIQRYQERAEPPASAEPAFKPASTAKRQGTLNSRDLEPAWRGQGI